MSDSALLKLSLPAEEKQLLQSMYAILNKVDIRLERLEKNNVADGWHSLSHYLRERDFPVSRHVFNMLRKSGKAPQTHNNKYRDADIQEFKRLHPNYTAPEFRKVSRS